MLSTIKILAVAALWYIKSSSLPKYCIMIMNHLPESVQQFGIIT